MIQEWIFWTVVEIISKVNACYLPQLDHNCRSDSNCQILISPLSFLGGDLTILKIFPSEADLCDIKTNIPCPVDHCPRIFKSSSNLTMHLEKYHKLIEPNRSSLEKKSDNVIYQYYCPVKFCQYHDNIKSNKKKIFFDQLKYLKQVLMLIILYL